MRTISLSVLIVTIMFIISAKVCQSSSMDFSGVSKPVVTNVRLTDQENVLIFMDDLPWGTTCLQTILDSLGAAYSEAPSSQMATIDMDQFDVIILASAQPTGFYREFQAQLDRFEDYLESGGILEFHTATLEMYFWMQLTLPGGVTHELLENHFNYVVDENHPIVAGLPDTLHGSFASHEHYANLPFDTDTITIDEAYQPTTIEYPIGAGTVIATGMAWEFNYNYGYTSGGCLPNAIAYSLSISGGNAVTISLIPVNPPIQIPPSGGSFDFNVVLENSEPDSVAFDAWIMVQLPDLSWFGPVLGPVELTLPGMTIIDRDRTQNVPAGALSGTYTYEARIGNYPDEIWESDSFTFEKLATRDGVVDNWLNFGEDFLRYEASSVFSPSSVCLFPCYPNPFNPLTTISFALNEAAYVNLTIYDISGCSVAELENGWCQTGRHELAFDASNLASGIYIYSLTAGNNVANGKMMLMK